MPENDKTLAILAGALQGIIVTAQLALRAIGEERAGAVKAGEPKDELPAMAGRKR